MMKYWPSMKREIVNVNKYRASSRWLTTHSVDYIILIHNIWTYINILSSDHLMWLFVLVHFVSVTIESVFTNCSAW